TITRYSYALAPVKVKENVKQLKGIRAHGDVSLLKMGETVRTEKGEVQFTDYGLSGIAVMQLSRLVNENDKLTVDLMPDFSQDEILKFLIKRRSALSHLKTEDFLSGILHKTLGVFILNRIGISPAKKAELLTEDEIGRIAKSIKALPFTVLSVLGKEHSQVTCGGAQLSDFNLETLESKIVPKLYCIGETLDCVGDCGGYNLHWAWTTAKIAGKAVSKC
ncbi:MAG: NAD(P)/FAD-dependent oxidoreductase, partial [Clostridia bacterium]|nr:NAD(P)/FAD-dependent oxidoreductase [Clostridia bacterium]